MRNNYLLVIVVMTLSVLINPACTKQEGTNATTPKIADLEKLRHLKKIDWPKAYRDQDTILLDLILGDDFQMIDASGNWYSKADELLWIKEHATQHDSFFYEIKRLELLPNQTAIICGTGHIFNDTTETIYQSSNVLIKRNENWKAVLSHVSGIKEK